MASSSSKPRSTSPFRFYRSSSSQENANSTHVAESMASSSSSQLTGFNFASKNHSFMGRSFTSSKGRSCAPPVSQKGKISSPCSVNSMPTSLDSRGDFIKAKECVAVTIRFRPLSPREIQKGDEVAWYADGDTIVRSENNQQTAYAFDCVFGPATTTRAIYDAAARHIVRGAMEGVNGTVFAYGVTSSGKTHTMHGDKKSPGIIPLAVKDVFGIIQDTVGREFLLRVSYLEIYNEVINDLLNPAGQNLKIREDSQGIYVEGVKEEVVLSPAHALSLIAAGEEHRHVGSNNFNLLSSRSHTIFTLTIESSLASVGIDDEEVTLSQLNLIDLAGSESSKTETTGLRRKEGSYINKSLLTLGTVISKLSDGKASHVPFRDSKLTRLLQSSLSGHGRVSLICTITPASSNFEETHNTLKFAHRAKRVEIHAAPNRIMDEKSLIKKYQKEITTLKEELDHLKRGILEQPRLMGAGSQEDLLNLRQQLEAGQVKMQSRLEEEEQAKAALMGRIQRLTKLILVSTKNSIPDSLPELQPGHRRRHSSGEDERNENTPVNPVQNGQMEYPRDGSVSTSSSTLQSESTMESEGSWRSVLSRMDDFPPAIQSFSQCTQAGELFSATLHGRRPPPTGETMADQMDLLREQIKMLSGEVAFRMSSLKRMREQAARNPDDGMLQAQIQNMKVEIQEKRTQISVLEKRILGTGEAALNSADPFKMSQNVGKLMGQLNEKTFELEIKSADNRILQEQLQAKISENCELRETINSLRNQLASVTWDKSLNKDKNAENSTIYHRKSILKEDAEVDEGWLSSNSLSGELSCIEGAMTRAVLESSSCTPQGSSKNVVVDSGLQSQVHIQAAEIEKLKQENIGLMEEKRDLQIQAQKLAEEASYAKDLASAAAVELKNLAEEVTKLSFQNAKLIQDLAAAQGLAYERVSAKPAVTELQRELHVRTERQAGLEAALADKQNMEAQLQRKLEEAKQKEAELESHLAGMWVLVAKLNKDRVSFNELTGTERRDTFGAEIQNNGNDRFHNLAEEDSDADGNRIKVKGLENGNKVLEELETGLEVERQKSAEMQILISQLKSEELDGLNVPALEVLQNFHVEALTKLCQAKATMQQRLERERERVNMINSDSHEEERNAHICKICFEAPTAAVLLPCRHFCLCKKCAVACVECPLCRSGIVDRIITFTS